MIYELHSSKISDGFLVWVWVYLETTIYYCDLVLYLFRRFSREDRGGRTYVKLDKNTKFIKEYIGGILKLTTFFVVVLMSTHKNVA